MPEGEMTTKPDKEGGKGGQETEVGGRLNVLKTCWNCGAGNWIPSYWTYFVCWSCSALCYCT